MRHLGSVFDTMKMPTQLFRRSERGITGLETAIILIAFVVVASVFAFTVLSTGLFSSERGKETVYAGLAQARGSVELKGSLVANGVGDIIMHSADTLWTNVGGSNITVTLETVDKKEGTGSVEIDVATAFTTGQIARQTLSPALDLSQYDSFSFWMKSERVTLKGQLEFIIDDDADCTSPSELIAVPVLTAGLWKDVQVGISKATIRTSIACIGFNIATDLSVGSSTKLNIDQLTAQGQIISIVILVANSVSGVPIDLTEPADANADGIADSEDKRHKVLITYNDDVQLVNDLYWTKNFVGAEDGDDLLEQGERVELNIRLGGLDQAKPLRKDTQFTLEVKPSGGSVLIIQRNSPSQITSVMNLR